MGWIFKQRLVTGNISSEGDISYKYIVFDNKCKWLFFVAKDKLKIGCKEKTWDEWDEWFKCKEEFESKRGTKEFSLIENGYKCAKQQRETLLIWDKYNPHGQ